MTRAGGVVAELFAVFWCREFAVFKAGDGLGQRLIRAGFVPEGVEVGVASGVKKAKPREVSVGTELLGSRGEKQEGLDGGGQ